MWLSWFSWIPKAWKRRRMPQETTPQGPPFSLLHLFFCTSSAMARRCPTYQLHLPPEMRFGNPKSHFHQSPPKGVGKMVPREKLSKSVEKLFDAFWRFLSFFPCAKIVEKLFRHFLTFFDAWPLSAGPFCNPLIPRNCQETPGNSGLPIKEHRNATKSRSREFREIHSGDPGRAFFGTGKRGHYESGLFSGEISRISKISSPVLPFLVFWKMTRKTSQETRIFYSHRTPKIPGKEGKDAPIHKEFLARGKKQGIPKKQGKEGQGASLESLENGRGNL